MRKGSMMIWLLIGFCVHSIAQDKVGSPMTVGEQTFLEHASECLTLIERAAQEIPITGVAMIAFIPGERTESWVSRMKVVGKLADAKVNLLGIANAKAAEMAVTLKDSGNPARKEIRGEFGYRGGVIRKVDGGYLVGAFSGGSSQDDVDVTVIGLDWLTKQY